MASGKCVFRHMVSGKCVFVHTISGKCIRAKFSGKKVSGKSLFRRVDLGEWTGMMLVILTRVSYIGILQVLMTKNIKFKIFACLIYRSPFDYMGSSTETVAFQEYEILKIDHEFLQFF